PGVASLAAVTVASKKVSPTRNVTDPSACLANFPVSSVISRPSDSSIRLVIGFIINKLLYLLPKNLGKVTQSFGLLDNPLYKKAGIPFKDTPAIRKSQLSINKKCLISSPHLETSTLRAL